MSRSPLKLTSVATPARAADEMKALASQSSTMYATSGAVRWLLTQVTYRPDRSAAQAISMNRI